MAQEPVMQLWVLEVGSLTTMWHCGGGLVIVAKDEDSARMKAVEMGLPTVAEAIPDGDGTPTVTYILEEEWLEAITLDLGLTDLTHGWAFPDSGCC